MIITIIIIIIIINKLKNENLNKLIINIIKNNK